MNEEKNDIFEIIVKKAKSASLKETEKNALLRSIETFIERHPLETRKPLIPQKSPLSSFMFMRTASFALVAFLIVGTSTSFAAQSSLPGDLLYPVKVNVNEEVKEFFLNDSEKVQFETARANQRIREAQVLSKQGRLTDKAKSQVTEKFNRHVAKVRSDLSTFKQKGELAVVLEVINELELSLSEQEDSLMALTAEREDSKLSEITLAVRFAKENTSVDRAETEDEISESEVKSPDIARAKLAAAKKLIASVEGKRGKAAEDAFISTSLMEAQTPASSDTGVSLKSAASVPTEDIELTDDLEEARELFRQGEQKFNEGRYNEAFILFRQAYNLAQSANDEISEDSELRGIEFELENTNIENFDESEETSLNTESQTGTSAGSAIVPVLKKAQDDNQKSR